MAKTPTLSKEATLKKIEPEFGFRVDIYVNTYVGIAIGFGEYLSISSQQIKSIKFSRNQLDLRAGAEACLKLKMVLSYKSLRNDSKWSVITLFFNILFNLVICLILAS